MAIRSVVEVRGNDLYSGGKIRIYNRDKNHRGVIITIQEDDMKSPHKALCLSVGECMTLVESILEALKEDMTHAGSE